MMKTQSSQCLSQKRLPGASLVLITTTIITIKSLTNRPTDHARSICIAAKDEQSSRS